MGMVNVAQKGKRTVVTDYFGRPYDQVPVAERRRCVSGYHLRYVVEGMVRGITAKVIRHYYGGSGAATTDHMMLLPRIPRDYLFTKREQQIIQGYAAHEICHQLYTHFEIMEKIFPGHKDDPKYQPTKRQKHLKAFWNAIEDYRIEKVCRPDYPGFPIYINVTRDHSAEKFLERVENGEFSEKKLSNPFFIGAVALTWVGARLNRYKTMAPEQALQAIDPSLRCWVESWEKDLHRVATNQDSLDLAERIIEALYQEADGNEEGENDSGEQPPQNNDGQQSEQSTDQHDDEPEQTPESEEETDGESHGADNGAQDSRPVQQEDDGEAGSADADGKQEESDDSEPLPDADDQDSEGDEEEPERPKLDIEEGDDEEEPEAADLDIDDIRKQLQHVKPQDEAEDADIVPPNEIGNGIDREQVAKNGALAFAQIRSSIGGAASRSAGIVRRMLQARNTTRIARGREDGDLDFERVVGMALGESTIHKQLSKRIQQNTALTLLLDNSGSMKGHPLKVCQQTAVVLDMAVAGTKTATEIVGFTSDWDGQVKLYQYRTFEQKGASSASSLGNMDNVTLGGTPVATPLHDTIRRMLPRPEERKIIILVSDGGADDPEQSASARALAESMGMIVVGIAVGSPQHLSAMKKWCDRSHGIASIDDLPLALASIVQEIMR